jgi:hypothetical protein
MPLILSIFLTFLVIVLISLASSSFYFVNNQEDDLPSLSGEWQRHEGQNLIIIQEGNTVIASFSVEKVVVKG